MLSIQLKTAISLCLFILQTSFAQNAASLKHMLSLPPLPDEISANQFANMISEYGSNVLAITIMPQVGCSTPLSAPPNNVVVTGAEVLSPSDELQSKLREGLKKFNHENDRPGAIVYYFCSNTKTFPKKLVAGKLGFQLNKQKRNLEQFESFRVNYQTRLLEASKGIDVDTMVRDALN